MTTNGNGIGYGFNNGLYGPYGYGFYGGPYGPYNYPGLGYGYGYDPVISTVNNANLANMANNERVAFGIGNYTNNGIYATREAVERNGMANLMATANYGTSNLVATERNGGMNMLTSERVGSQLLSAIDRNANQIISNAAVIAAQQNAAINGNTTAINAVGSNIQLQLANSTNQINQNILDSKNDVQKDIADSKSFLAMLTTQAANDLKLQAAQNQAATISKLDKEFCHTNSLIVETGAKTDALITSVDTQRLQAELAAANTQILIDRVRRPFPPFPPPPPPPPPP